MGLNCEQGPTAEPDGTCASCRAIIGNSSMDVLEMDAASNRGIDEIRDLRDKVNLAPVAARTKVYIIDEVHMLTTEAFNALLKMLEEPPEQVVFVLATTEKHKVPPTIVSRCQSFDFRRPSVALLSEKLREIAAAEGIEAEPEALTIMAREGRGSFRDAEGLLDQLASFADGPVTAAQVRELLGSTGSEVLLETTDALYERRAADALRSLDRLSNEGKDLSQFAGELVAHLRRLMLLPDAPEVALAEVGAEERAGLEEQARRVPTAEVVRMIESLGATISRAKRGGDPKLELELTFLKLARDYEEPPVEAFMARLEALEKAVTNGGTNAVASRPEPVLHEESGSAGTVGNDFVRDVGEGSGVPELGRDAEGEDDVAEAEPARSSLDWGSVMRELSERKQKSSETIFKEAVVSRFDGQTLELVFPEDQQQLLGLAKDHRYLEPLQQVLKERLGSRLRLELRATGDAPETPSVNAVEPPRTEPPSPVPETEAQAAPVPDRSQGREPARVRDPLADQPPEPKTEGAPDGGGPGKADGTIQSQLEVFELFRERSGGPGGTPGGKQNGG
jgi:DNA polymerase-3 subunit gamma/tau